MNSDHLNQISTEAFKRLQITDDMSAEVKVFSEKQAPKIAREVKDLPDNARTPTAEEIGQMVIYMRNYRTQSPKASKRAIREACKKHFNILILPV